MKKVLILLIIPVFLLFLNTSLASANNNSLDITDDYFLYNNTIYSEDYQNGYRQGYEDGFSHDNRVKIALWEHDSIYVNELDTVYRYRFNAFISTYDIVSPTGLPVQERKKLVFIPTFDGHVGLYSSSVRQWFLDEVHFLLYVEKPIIESIMTRDSVNEITAFRIYLEENNIYGYFERASGLTDYQIGYNNGYEQGFNTAMKDTTNKLMSSVLLLIGPILLINIALLMLKDFKMKY